MALLLTTALTFGLVVLAWGVYPVVMWVRARKAGEFATGGLPVARVCAVIATRDDPSIAADRVGSLLTGNYPRELLQVVVAVDANAAAPLAGYREALNGLADVVQGDPPGGKATALNAGVRASVGCDVLLFADVGQEFNPLAVTRLVQAIEAGAQGATGRYAQRRDDAVMARFADFEALIRRGQAAGGSVVSATGAIFAMQPAFWRDLPPGLICDDLYTGLSIVHQGGRVTFCPDAVALDLRTFTRDQQFARRARTLTGLIQYCLTVPGVFLPWRNPVWLHFLLHKLLRLLTPVLLCIGTVSLIAWSVLHMPGVLVMMAGVAALLIATAILAAPAMTERLGRQLSWTLRLVFVPLVAIVNGLRGHWSVWTPTPQGRG